METQRRQIRVEFNFIHRHSGCHWNCTRPIVLSRHLSCWPPERQAARDASLNAAAFLFALLSFLLAQTSGVRMERPGRGPSWDPIGGPNETSNGTEPSLSQSSELELDDYQLPSWFNYETYKSLFGTGKQRRMSAGRNGLVDEQVRRRIYLKVALQVFEQRALFRAARTDSLWSITGISDWVSELNFHQLLH